MWRRMYKYSFWTLNANGSISSVSKKAHPPYIFVHYCENEPTYDFKVRTFWTEFETDSSEAASRGTGIFVEECRWRAVISLTEQEAGEIMVNGGLRWQNDHPPAREYQSLIVIPLSRCTVTQLTQP